MDAIQFCNLLSKATGLEPCYSTGDDPNGEDVVCDWKADGYRLPMRGRVGVRVLGRHLHGSVRARSPGTATTPRARCMTS
jgi:hypothetical protein